MLSGTTGAIAPRWSGAALYIIPFGAALVLLGAAIGGRIGAWLTVGGTGMVVALDLAVSAALRWGPVTSPGTGAWMLHAGVSTWALTVMIGLMLEWRERAAVKATA